MTKEIVKYNREKLIKGKVLDKKEYDWIQFREERRFLGIRMAKAGLYDLTGYKRDESDLDRRCYLIENSRVYVKPKVILYFREKHEAHYYFDTFIEAEDFMHSILIESKSKYITWENF